MKQQQQQKIKISVQSWTWKRDTARKKYWTQISVRLNEQSRARVSG